MYDENEFFIMQGRKASSAGVTGLFLGIIISLIITPGKLLSLILILSLIYFFITGYWGVTKLNRWFRKYRYKMPPVIWNLLRVIITVVGYILGIIGWGFFEHFILLLSMESIEGRPGLIGAQIILLPWIGPWYAKKINYRY